MKQIFYFIALLLACVALTSCGGLNLLTFDQMDAAEYNFPSSIKRVAVVNTLPVVNYSDDKVELEERMLGDGQVAAESLAKAIADAHYFDEVVIADSLTGLSVMKGKKQALSPDEVQTLSADLNVDMLIAVEYLGIKNRLDYFYLPEFIEPVHAIHATVSTVLRTYVPEKEKPLYTVVKRDSAIWDLSMPLTPEGFIKEASELGAIASVNSLVPHWKQTHRYYYDGSMVAMRDAGVFVRENNWEDAAALWKSLYDKKKKGAQAMKAAYNLALYCEMTDRIDEACQWIDKAVALAKPGSSDQSYAKLYQQTLYERQQKITRLNIQMQRFDEIFDE